MISTSHPWQNNDPADLLRRQKRANEMMLRAQLRKAAADEQDPDEEQSIYELAAEAEGLVKEELRAAGYKVAITNYNEHHDLTVDGVLRVEVKAARWHLQNGKRGRYQVNLRDCQAGACDLVIVMLRNGKDSFFVIPAADLAGQHSLTVRCHSITHYTGKWRAYYNRWDLIAPALDAARQARPEQLALEVEYEPKTAPHPLPGLPGSSRSRRPSPYAGGHDAKGQLLQHVVRDSHSVVSKEALRADQPTGSDSGGLIAGCGGGAP